MVPPRVPLRRGPSVRAPRLATDKTSANRARVAAGCDRAWVSTALGPKLTTTMEHEAFYATAAHVLPILYAILFIETRYLGAAPGPLSPLTVAEARSVFWSVVSILITLLFAVAELAAVGALMRPGIAGRADELIWAAMGLLLAAVTLIPIAPQFAILWNRSPLGRIIHLAPLVPAKEVEARMSPPSGRN